MGWIEPVTDRTQEDVDYANRLLAKPWSEFTANEQTEYNNGLKGCLNRADLERIEGNMQYLAQELHVTLESGEIPEFPTTEYFVKLQKNANALKDAALPKIEVPAQPWNHFRKVNQIERMLMEICDSIRAPYYYYIGEMYVNDDVGLI